VGVPEGRVDQVVAQLRNVVIRGKAAQVRRYVDNGAPRDAGSGHRPERKPWEKKSYAPKAYGDRPTGGKPTGGKPTGKKPYGKKKY
jgi:hypothetical protein